MPNNNEEKKVKKIKPYKGTISSSVKDYSKDPFVIRKNEQAQKTIEKYGLPKELITNNK
jgi:hypothetical protein